MGQSSSNGKERSERDRLTNGSEDRRKTSTRRGNSTRRSLTTYSLSLNDGTSQRATYKQPNLRVSDTLTSWKSNHSIVVENGISESPAPNSVNTRCKSQEDLFRRTKESPDTNKEVIDFTTGCKSARKQGKRQRSCTRREFNDGNRFTNKSYQASGSSSNFRVSPLGNSKPNTPNLLSELTNKTKETDLEHDNMMYCSSDENIHSNSHSNGQICLNANIETYTRSPRRASTKHLDKLDTSSDNIRSHELEEKVDRKTLRDEERVIRECEISSNGGFKESISTSSCQLIDLDKLSTEDTDSTLYDNSRCGTPILPAFTDNTDVESVGDSQCMRPKYRRSASACGNLNTYTAAYYNFDTFRRSYVEDTGRSYTKTTAANSNGIGADNNNNNNRTVKQDGGSTEDKIIRLEKMFGELTEALTLTKRRQTRAHSISSLSSSQWSYSQSHKTMVGKSKRSMYSRHTSTETKSLYKRFQRIESHIITLARSVAHLSSQISASQTSSAELQSLKQEIEDLTIKYNQISSSEKQKGLDSKQQENTTPNNSQRLTKLTRFFGQEPPMLSAFLKQLGYEMYESLFNTEKVGMVELPYMSDNTLKYIGIPLGPRTRILEEARTLADSLPQIRNSTKTKSKPCKNSQKSNSCK